MAGILERIHRTQTRKEYLRNNLSNLTQNNKYVVDKYQNEFLDMINMMKDKSFDSFHTEYDGINIQFQINQKTTSLSHIKIDFSDDYSDTVSIVVDESNMVKNYGKEILSNFTIIDTLKDKKDHDGRLKKILDAFKWFMYNYDSLIENTEHEIKNALSNEIDNSNYYRGRNSILKIRHLKSMIQDGINGKVITVKPAPVAKKLDINNLTHTQICKLMNKSYYNEIATEVKVLAELVRNSIPSVEKKEEAILNKLRAMNDGNSSSISKKNAVILIDSIFEFHFYNDKIELAILNKNRQHIGRFIFNANNNRRFYLETSVGYSSIDTFGLETGTVVEFINSFKYLKKNWNEIFGTAFNEYEKTLKTCLIKLAEDVKRLESEVCQADADEARNQRIIENMLEI